MIFVFPPFTIVFGISVILAITCTVIIWTRRPAPGAAPLAFFLLAVTEWLVARTFEAGAVDIGDKILWGKMMFLGALNTGTIWLYFSLDYTGSVWQRKPFHILVIYIPIVISLIMILTNDIHGLVWPNVYPSPNTNGSILVWEHGPWFWIMGGYNHVLIATGFVILWRDSFHRQGIYRRQISTILIGTLIPVVANVIYLLGFSPVKGLDLTPFAFTLSGFVYSITIFRFRFLDIVPIARSTVVENIPDGVIVADKFGIIVDMNHSAERITGMQATRVIGKSLEDTWPVWSAFTKHGIDENGHNDLVIEEKEIKRYLDINITTLATKSGGKSGHLLVLKDITDRIFTQQRLEELYRQERTLRNNLKEEINKRNKYSEAIDHELRIPIMSILASEKLLEEANLDQNQIMLLHDIRKASLSLEECINKLFSPENN